MKLQRSGLMGIVFTVIICLALCSGSYTTVAGWEIGALQKEIDARGYEWRAGKTSLSDLSSEERKSMLGLNFPEKIKMIAKEMRFVIPYGQPTTFDWRNYNGGNWITSVKNQQQCGSCYSFATLGTMETLIRLSQSNLNLSIDLSEQYVVSCGPSGTQGEYDYGGCEGNYTDYVCDFLVSTGAPDEACFPYDSSQQTGTEPPCANACADVASRAYKISSYSFIAGEVGYVPYPEYIKAVVVNKPVPCGMLVYDDFYDYVGGIYQPVPEPGDEGGGHLVLIIGYDDSQSCWIVKNSWGTDWGETANFTPYTPGAGDGGYFRIGYVTSADTLTYIGTDAVDMNYGGGTSTTTTGPSTTTTIPNYVCPPDYPIDCGNGYCCSLAYPFCLYGVDEGYCSQCPAGAALNNDDVKLGVLREMRDTRMASATLGRSFISLYYEHAEEISDIMLADEKLLTVVANVLNEIVEKAALLNNNEVVSIDQKLIENILGAADAINKNASPDLKMTIENAKEEIKKGDIFRQLGIKAVKGCP